MFGVFHICVIKVAEVIINPFRMKKFEKRLFNMTIKMLIFIFRFSAGIFLIPYFIILFVCGVPMLFMELAVGQYTGRGPIGAIGQLCPLFKGLKWKPLEHNQSFRLTNRQLIVYLLFICLKFKIYRDWYGKRYYFIFNVNILQCDNRLCDLLLFFCF